MTEYFFKIIVIGDMGVGKSAFVRRYVHNMYSQAYKSTVGVDFALKVMKWKDGITIRLQLWDIAGQERFGQMTRVYYKDAVGALLLYDVTQPASFQSVKKWKLDVDQKVLLSDDRPIPCVLIGNKIDLLPPGPPARDSEFMDSYCEENGFLAWFESSAKTGQGVEAAIKRLVSQIIENSSVIGKSGGASNNNNSSSISISQMKDVRTTGNSAPSSNRNASNSNSGCCS